MLAIAPVVYGRYLIFCASAKRRLPKPVVYDICQPAIGGSLCLKDALRCEDV